MSGLPRLFLAFALCLLASLTPAQRDPEVLVADEATSTAWTIVRFRLQTHTAGLRNAVRTNQYEAFRTTIDGLREDLSLHGRIAAAVAPDNEWEDLRTTLERAGRLLENFERDASVGSPQELMHSARLLEETLVRIEDLSMQVDLRNRGLPDARSMALPPDWGELRHPDESLRGTLVLMNAREITAETRRRWGWLNEQARTSLKPEAGIVSREISELGRALVLRQGELPDLMRPGFRNAALQVEVIGENLADYHEARDRHRFRQQTGQLDAALARLEEYLAMRDRAN